MLTVLDPAAIPRIDGDMAALHAPADEVTATTWPGSVAVVPDADRMTGGASYTGTSPNVSSLLP